MCVCVVAFIQGAIDWDNMLLAKANFVPVLDDEMDTSYFQDRSDRCGVTITDCERSQQEERGGEEGRQGNRVCLRA